jgi:hypothetical protein
MSNAHYSVLRYVPDPGRGESLNIGILLWEEGTDAYRLSVDEKAVERVIRENPRLERDALLYVEPMLLEQLSSAISPVTARIKNLMDKQVAFPLDMSEPRFTTIAPDEGGLDQTLDRLIGRVVRPKRRSGPRHANPMEAMDRALSPLISAEAVSRNHFFGATKTGVLRSADFFANSGANVALDVVRLALKESDRIRERADAEAFKVYDVLQADSSINDYVVYCDFADSPESAEINENARLVIEDQGAHVLTDLDEAASVLSNAAVH